MARGDHWNANSRQVIGTSNTSLMKDTGSPFYLHNGDNPSLVLVSHNLTGSNYNTWSHVMLMVLIVKNKVGFINGSIDRLASNHLLLDVFEPVAIA